MNIVIPMAGRGSRFQEAGYSLPKPLIDVNGEPMIIKALRTMNIYGKYHFVIRKDEHSEKLKLIISDGFPDYIKPKFIEIDYITEGPASSVLLFEKEINNTEELIVANCDQVMWWDSEKFLNDARFSKTAGTIVTYWANTEKNSYARLDKKGYVQEVREKIVISNTSLNGIHYWKNGKFFINSTKEMMKNNDRAPNGEFYVGPTYNYMIYDGFDIGIHHIANEQHHAIGTPEDLQKYIQLEKDYNEVNNESV